MNNRTRLVLFDFDGTLADTTPAVVESYRYAFDEVLGVQYPATAEDLREILRVRFVELCSAKAADRVEELRIAFRARYLGDLEHQPQLYPGVREMLSNLTDSGFAIGIVTNKSRVATDCEMRRCELTEMPFRCVITADDACRGKPDPMPILLGIEAAGASFDDVYYVGDAGHDMAAARSAGVRGIGAAYGDFGAEHLRVAGADDVIDHPCQLPGVLRIGSPHRRGPSPSRSSAHKSSPCVWKR